MSDNRPPPAALRRLLVPHAGPRDADFRAALSGLALPSLDALLARLQPTPPDTAPEESLSPPHERALARASGLPDTDGLIPTAAAYAHERGLAAHTPGWAWLAPCHWQVGMNEVMQADPDALQLSADESRTFMEAMRPYLAEDGLTLHEGPHPAAWLVHGPLLAGLPTASVDRVVGRNIETWNLGGAAARPLRRLQQEMQMLLYTHPANDARTQRGLPPVNSFWLSGTGDLPAQWQPPRERIGSADGLLQATWAQDPAAWRVRWQQLDAQLGRTLLAAARAGEAVELVLCGERSAQAWHSAPMGLVERLRRRLRPPRAADVLAGL